MGQSNEQRKGAEPCETEEEPGQVTNHSARSFHVQDSPQKTAEQPETPLPMSGSTERPKKIRWPPAARTKEWSQLDKDLNKIIEAATAGKLDKQIKTMTTITLAVGAERFGIQEAKGKRPDKGNRRQRQIGTIRKELRNLRKQYKQASETEKGPLSELREIQRKKLKTLRRAENHRRRRKERQRKRTAFIQNPFRFTRELLGDRRSGRLECTRGDGLYPGQHI